MKLAIGKTSITKIEIETQISLHSIKVNKKTIKKEIPNRVQNKLEDCVEHKKYVMIII